MRGEAFTQTQTYASWDDRQIEGPKKILIRIRDCTHQAGRVCLGPTSMRERELMHTAAPGIRHLGPSPYLEILLAVGVLPDWLARNKGHYEEKFCRMFYLRGHRKEVVDMRWANCPTDT